MRLDVGCPERNPEICDVEKTTRVVHFLIFNVIPKTSCVTLTSRYLQEPLLLTCFCLGLSGSVMPVIIITQATSSKLCNGVDHVFSLQRLFAANFSNLFMCDRSQSWVMYGK